MNTIWYRREVRMKDLNYHHSDEDGTEFIKGFIYTLTKDEDPYSEFLQENMHIEIADERFRGEGKYYLILERSEYQSDDLASLEKLLMEWMEYEGYADNVVLIDCDETKKEIDFLAINRAFASN